MILSVRKWNNWQSIKIPVAETIYTPFQHLHFWLVLTMSCNFQKCFSGENSWNQLNNWKKSFLYQYIMERTSYIQCDDLTMSALYTINMLRIMFIVLAHLNNSLWGDMSLHLEIILSCFRANQVFSLPPSYYMLSRITANINFIIFCVMLLSPMSEKTSKVITFTKIFIKIRFHA
jgi:hypothetical protein